MYDRLLICNRMLIARKNKFLKQEEVCTVLGINQSSYSALETGKRDMTVPELMLLADLFDVPVTWLLGVNSVPQLTDNECLEVENYINYIVNRRKK